MEFLDELKFIDETGNEYFIAEQIIINQELYCLIIDLNDNSNIMYAHIEKINDEFRFENIENEEIIKKINDKLTENKL